MGEQQQNKELIHKAKITAVTSKDPLEKIRAKILSRGAAGFKTLRRRFLIMDDDRSHSLSYEEFKTGLIDIGVDENLLQAGFKLFDKDNSNTVDMDEFVVALQPEMNEERTAIVKKCFMLMDKTGDQKITAKDLIGCYDVTKNPKFLSGDWNEARVYREFLNTFQPGPDPDEVITMEEFISYYASLSASIDNDAYFKLMMQNSWKILDNNPRRV